MVRAVNVSFRQDLQVPGPGESRFIGGPLYLVRDLETILTKFNPKLQAWTRKCQEDLTDRFGMDALDRIAKLLGKALKAGSYVNSQWCEATAGGPFAPCDAYVIEHEGKDLYLKFCIASSGMLIYLASCHDSN